MKRFPEDFRDYLPASNTAQDDSSPKLPPLFIYPSLKRLFEGADKRSLLEMRERLSRTHRDFERVIRQGSAEDAARAERIARAYTATLALLLELEELRKFPRP